MSMKRIAIMMTLLLAACGLSQAQLAEWVETTPAGVGSERIFDRTVDEDGNIYLCGHFTGTMYLPTDTLNVSGITDAMVMKMDSNGVIQWARKVSSPDLDFGWAIEVDGAGAVYVVGQHHSTLFFETLPFMNTVGTSSVFVVKFSANGDEMWSSSVAGPGGQAPSNVAWTPAGNLIIVGYTNAALTIPATGVPAAGGFIVEMDTAGNINWAKQACIGSISQEVGLDITPAGDIYICGAANDSVQFGPSSYIYGDPTYRQAFVAKYNSSGNLQWMTFDGGIKWDYYSALEADGFGNVYVSGGFDSSAVYGGTTLSGTDEEVVVAKYTSLGNLAWVKQFSGPDKERGHNISRDNAGNLYLTVQMDEAITIDGVTLNTVGTFYNSFVLAKLDENGDRIWAKVYAETNTLDGKGNMTWPDNHGHLYLMGDFSVNMDIDGMGAAAGSGSDWFVARLTDTTWVAEGDSVWPGDANNDGIANNLDLLALGVAYGETGPARPVTGNSWMPHYADDWTTFLISGANSKHGDCNGSGQVDLNDTLAISMNYGLTHAKGSGISSSTTDPELYVEFTDDSLMIGETAEIVIYLGRDTLPADDMYGVAFTLSLDPELVDTGTIELSYSGSWMGTKNNNMISMHKYAGAGELDMALTRIDHTNISGFGEIARLSVVMVDDLSGKDAALSELLSVEVLHAHMIDKDEASLPVALGSGSATIYQITSIENISQDAIKLYPNPSNGQLFIDLSELPQESVQLALYSLDGQLQMTKDLNGGKKNQLNLSMLPAGAYFYMLSGREAVVKGKIMKQ